MIASELEDLLAAAIAQMARAQQKTVPMLDLCYPRMVDAKGYEEMRAAKFDIALSISALSSAVSSLKQAALMIAEFTERSTK